MENVRQQSGEAPAAEPRDESRQVEAPVVVRKRSMWDDPVVRWMGYSAIVLVILYLVAVVSALYFGLLGSETPRSVVERDLIKNEGIAKTKGATVDQWQDYVISLIADRQFTRAKQEIDAGTRNKDFDPTRGQNMLFCQAELQRAQGDLEVAFKTYAQVMKKTHSAWKKEYDEGPEFQNWAVAYGLHDNYYLSALARASILTKQEKWAEAVKEYDIYLGKYPQQASILVERADAKAKAKDVKGAEADYRKALKFIPDYEDALAGLKRIGAGE